MAKGTTAFAPLIVGETVSILEPRPWGTFEILAKGPGFWVKKLTVQPGGRTSLQRHHHRSELFSCLAGTGIFYKDEGSFAVVPGAEITVPVCTLHRIECPKEASGPLVLLEIARGAVLAEDDIERLEDDYGRA